MAFYICIHTYTYDNKLYGFEFVGALYIEREVICRERLYIHTHTHIYTYVNKLYGFEFVGAFLLTEGERERERDRARDREREIYRERLYVKRDYM